MSAARRMSVAACLTLAALVTTAHRVAAGPQRLGGTTQQPPTVCFSLDLSVVLPYLLLDLHLEVVIGGTDCTPPPPSTTTTTTTTTTQPPSTTSTSTSLAPSTTTSTTLAPTTTQPRLVAATDPEPPAAPEPAPPPLPPPPPTPRLAVTATMDPEHPAAGEPATATIAVRNEGPVTTPVLELTDVLQGAEIRGATGGAAQCGVVARQADCQLQSLGPGETTTVEVRLLVDQSPAPSKVAQQIRLAATDDVIVADEAVAVPVASQDRGLAGLLAGPGTAVTLGTTFGLALAARPRTPSGGHSTR